MAAAESAPEPSVSLGEVAQEASAKIGQALPARAPSSTQLPRRPCLHRHLRPSPKPGPEPTQVLSAVAQGLKRARDAEGAEATPAGASGQAAAAPAAASKMARWEAIPGLSDGDSDEDD